MADIKTPYNMVEIKKLRTNFEIRYSFNKALTEYIKGLPKDQQQTKMDIVRKDDGSTYEDWYRVVNEVALARIIDFIKANNLRFKFANVTNEDIQRFKNEFLERQKTKEKILDVNYNKLDIGGIDWSFMKIEPYDYQKQAAVFCKESNGLAIIGDEPGTGKSAESILYGIMTKTDKKILVIVPASLKLSYRSEILKFSHEKAFVYKWKPRRKSNEIAYTKEESLFHIINYESIESYIKINNSHKCYQCKWQEINYKKKYSECPNCKREKTIKTKGTTLSFLKDKNDIALNVDDYDLVIIDEVHFIKNSNANRTKLIKKAFKDIPRKILMSATMILNRPAELFNPLNFMFPNEFKNQHYFGVRYCAGHEDKFGHWNFDGSSNEEELFNRISPFFIRRKKSEILKDLPPKTFTDIPIELSDEEWREYKKAEKGVVDELTNETTDIGYLEKVQKLKQFTSKIKIKHAIDIIENYINNDEKIVVFSEFLAPLDELKKYFGDRAVVFTGKISMNEKNEAVQKFMDKDSEAKVFLGSIGAASVGLTLNIATTVLMISQSFSPSINTQAHDRVHRVTTIGNCQIVTLYCVETIDEDIHNLLREKEKVISKILDGQEIITKSNKVDSSIFKDLINIFLSKKD